MPDDDLRKLEIAIEAMSEDMRLAIVDELVSIGNDMRNHIINEMQTTAKAKWSYRKTKSGKRHHPSKPFHFPAVDTGELLRSLVPFGRGARGKPNEKGIETKDWSVEVGVEGGAPYAEYLESGTRKMFPRPFMLPTLWKFEPTVESRILQAMVTAAYRTMPK